MWRMDCRGIVGGVGSFVGVGFYGFFIEEGEWFGFRVAVEC